MERDAAEKVDPVGALEGYIETLFESGGSGLMGWYTRGHVDRWAFAQAVNKHNDLPDHSQGFDRRWVRAEHCHHVWWRTVPCGDGESSFQDADPGSRGAWKATVWYIDHDSLERDLCSLRQTRLQRVYAFAAGVNWAYQMLQYAFPDAAKALLERWRADPPNDGREALEPDRQRAAERETAALRARLSKESGRA